MIVGLRSSSDIMFKEDINIETIEQLVDLAKKANIEVILKPSGKRGFWDEDTDKVTVTYYDGFIE
jgi:ACT domain-containing protein